jgi:hypothetical protein
MFVSPLLLSSLYGVRSCAYISGFAQWMGVNAQRENRVETRRAVNAAPARRNMPRGARRNGLTLNGLTLNQRANGLTLNRWRAINVNVMTLTLTL